MLNRLKGRFAGLALIGTMLGTGTVVTATPASAGAMLTASVRFEPKHDLGCVKEIVRVNNHYHTKQVVTISTTGRNGRGTRGGYLVNGSAWREITRLICSGTRVGNTKYYQMHTFVYHGRDLEAERAFNGGVRIRAGGGRFR